MTKTLASRMAGLKLGGIVAVLLIPMLVLSYFMMESLRWEIAFTEREIQGLAFNRIVHPIVMSASQGKIHDADLQRLRGEGLALAERLGFKAEMTGVLATLYTMGSDKRFALQPLEKLLAKSADRSNLILDPYPETYYLAAVVSLHAPGVLTSFAGSWTTQARVLKDGLLAPTEVTAILMSLGSWREAQKRFAEGFYAARAAALDPATYDGDAAIAEEMMTHPSNVARVFSRSEASELAANLAVIPEFTDMALHISEDVDGVWKGSSQRLDSMLRDRLEGLQAKLASMLAIAAAVCLLGCGSAAFMFRKTLRQLDMVQFAREDAERSRAEAEASAKELRKISDDVVKLNVDLSSNLRMLRDAQDDNMRKGKLAHLGQLTATVAHELRNPLGAVRTSAFLMERKLKGKGLGVEAQIERINNGVTRCDNIISQLLDFARTKPLQIEPLDLDSWLVRLIEDEAEKLPQAVTVECELGLAGTSVDFDPARMSRVLINLISNACEAMTGRNDESVKHVTAKPRIIIQTRHTARGAEVAVSDNGPGMDEALLGRIFEPLFTTKNFGTGLGLPAVQKVLEQHGGGLDVESRLGEGSRFTAWWPATHLVEEAA